MTLPGGLTQNGNAGANSFHFTGRLAPGAYRLVAVPTANGQSGRAATATFKIAR